MKTTLTTILACFIIALSPVSAQDFGKMAERETRQMAAAIKMSKKDFQKVKKTNQDRLEQIAALSELREQDRRYLDLRLDQIDEQYSTNMFKLLNTSQYRSFTRYRQEQPFTYASQIMKYNMVAQTKE